MHNASLVAVKIGFEINAFVSVLEELLHPLMSVTSAKYFFSCSNKILGSMASPPVSVSYHFITKFSPGDIIVNCDILGWLARSKQYI